MKKVPRGKGDFNIEQQQPVTTYLYAGKTDQVKTTVTTEHLNTL